MIIFVVFDYDGVFTDGKVFFDSMNKIIKYYNVKDGKGLTLLRDANIKYGLISNFNATKDIEANNLPINNLIDHLKFDKFYIGNKNKLEILNEWIKELNINYSNIAYIGDDLNDIEMIKKVGFSACPNDAVNECKQVVNYVCEKKGGEGCIREFIDLILKPSNNLIQEIKKEVNYQLDNFDLDKINILVDLVKIKNNIYITGIGKSETMAIHCTNLLKSIGIKAFGLNAINSLHGDIGTLKEDDLVIMFSKSGNTNELIKLIPFIKSKKVYLVGLTCDKNSLFSKYCDLIIELPFTSEIKGTINNIPTNSCMCQLLFSNILVSKLKEGIELDSYKSNHPAGLIGSKLKKISDCIIIDFPKILFEKQQNLHDILLEMTKFKIGCCFFVNNSNELIGILTDGDIRRLILKKEIIDIITINEINTNYYYEEDQNKFIFECKKFNYIPVLNNGKLVGII